MFGHIFGINHVAYRLHYCPAVTLNITVLLWSIRSARFPSNGDVSKKFVKSLITELGSFVRSNFLYIISGVSLNYLDQMLKKFERLGFLSGKVDKTIGRTIVTV
jgi:hypothetical protein